MMKKWIIGVIALALSVGIGQADLLLYYNFEETPGGTTVYDQSTYGFDGTLEAGYPGSSTALPEYITSVNGSQALLFGYDNGVMGAGWNDINVTRDPALAYIGQQFSMAFWARQDDNVLDWSGGWPRIISCPNYEIELGASIDTTTYFWPWGPEDPDWDMAMAPSPELGVWFHMVVTYDGKTLRQYINGEEVFKKTNLDPFDENSWYDEYPEEATLRIGTQSLLNKNYLVGALDDVAIWGHAYLDADAVAGLYSGVYDPSTAPTIPEPATLLLVGLGGVLIRKRRS